MAGTLYLVATPIGNLEDLSARALRTLEEVDYIAAEDTRHTIKLLNRFEIKKEMQSYHEFNKFEKGPKIIEDLLLGKNVALVSDAGTPGISDPGEELVKLCHEHNVPVTAIPGPCAMIMALVLSGLNTRRFVFEGFLSTQKKERMKVIELLKEETRTIILYEAPHKLKGTLKDLYKGLGNRSVALARELTKKFEEIQKMTIEEAIAHYDENDPRGEYVIVIEGCSEQLLEDQAIEKWESMTLEEHLEYYEKQGISQKEAIKLVAKDRKMAKRDVYDHFHRE